MKFEEVIPLLRAGKKVKRTGWADWASNCYVYLDKEGRLNANNGNRWDGDFLSEDDWEEFKEEPKPIFEETIQWFRPEDRLPNGSEMVLCLIEATFSCGEKVRELKLGNVQILSYGNCRVTKWAYAPKGE